MTVVRGDIVLVTFPFASGRGSKVRPALVVQPDHNNSRLTNTIIVQVTTNISRASQGPTQLLIDPATSEGQGSGLVSSSAITCENVATVEQSRVIRKVGSLPDDVMLQVDDCIKAAMGV